MDIMFKINFVKEELEPFRGGIKDVFLNEFRQPLDFYINCGT